MTIVTQDLQPLALNDQAYEVVKSEIIECRLAPGEEVSEARLAAAYGIGKAATRYALSKLGQEGYVISLPRRGHVIAPVTLKSVHEVFELRLLIEPHAAAKACGRIDVARLTELDRICAQPVIPGDAESENRFIVHNRAFHMEIVQAAGNDRVTRIMGQIMDEQTRLLHLALVLKGRPKELHSEHRDLIAALSDGDPDRAHAIVSEHVHRVRQLIIDGILAHSSLSEANIVTP